MKRSGKYLVWVLLALLILAAVAYSWNSREHFANQCWSSEMPISQTTGYITKSEKFGVDLTNYLKDIGRKEIEAGRCSRTETRRDNGLTYDIPLENCSRDSELLLSVDFAKEYCSTKNCTAIARGGNLGNMYFPIMVPLSTRPPENSDDRLASIAAIFLPKPCAPPPSATVVDSSASQPPRTFTCTAAN
jgi:hypothetical protein